jgi:threonine dehydratase
MLTLGSGMKQGVVAASSGNNGIAVVIAAKKLNLPVKIVVPESTPKVKIEKIMKYDVELMLYGNIYDDTERKALELAWNEGLTYISLYNDNFVIAGQEQLA